MPLYENTSGTEANAFRNSPLVLTLYFTTKALSTIKNAFFAPEHGTLGHPIKKGGKAA